MEQGSLQVRSYDLVSGGIVTKEKQEEAEKLYNKAVSRRLRAHSGLEILRDCARKPTCNFEGEKIDN